MDFGWIGFLLAGGVLFYLALRNKSAKQSAYIDAYPLPSKVAAKVKSTYPHLSDADVAVVFNALKDYFHMCQLGKKRIVSMPSQVVDVAWHEFILFTRSYNTFCKKAFGRFLHHTPTEAMPSPTLAHEGIKRAWRLACAREKLNPTAPVRLPLIFAIDDMLNIENGFRYSLNCQDKSSPMYGDGYCASHIGCASGCAGDSATSSDSSGFGDLFDGSSDSGGCSSGCGGGD